MGNNCDTLTCWRRSSDHQDISFTGAKQCGLSPEMAGISWKQLEAISRQAKFEDEKYWPHHRTRHVLSGPTMRDVVEDFVKPATKGSRMSYALMLNSQAPLRARVMVSHSWDENYEQFLKCLENSAFEGPFWVCATAIYQPEDCPDLTIAKQLGRDPSTGPFATVLRQADVMIAIVTLNCNLYERMWCIYEMHMAIVLEVPVKVTQFKYDARTVPLHKHCKEAVSSYKARCGNPAMQINQDEERIRAQIEATPGSYYAIDREIELARWAELHRPPVKMMRALSTEGWEAEAVEICSLVQQRLVDYGFTEHEIQMAQEGWRSSKQGGQLDAGKEDPAHARKTSKRW